MVGVDIGLQGEVSPFNKAGGDLGLHSELGNAVKKKKKTQVSTLNLAQIKLLKGTYKTVFLIKATNLLQRETDASLGFL